MVRRRDLAALAVTQPDVPPPVPSDPEIVNERPEDGPRYLTLVRKEARLRADQVDALAQLRRQVLRSRSMRAEPITDNTLIRVAVDLLLARRDRLHGDTEDELRASVLTD
jgi:hypothetical protein